MPAQTNRPIAQVALSATNSPRFNQGRDRIERIWSVTGALLKCGDEIRAMSGGLLGFRIAEHARAKNLLAYADLLFPILRALWRDPSAFVFDVIDHRVRDAEDFSKLYLRESMFGSVGFQWVCAHSATHGSTFAQRLGFLDRPMTRRFHRVRPLQDLLITSFQ